MLTMPLVFPLVDNSWRWSLAVWGVPLVAIAILTIALAPASKDGAALPPADGRSWWPDWSNKLIWQIGILFGSVNSVYFCSNAFLPGHLTDAGRPDLISAALTALNFGQLPASFALLAIAGRLERRAWPFILCGVLMLSVRRRHRHHGELVDGLLRRHGSASSVRVVLTLRLCAAGAVERAPADVARMSAAMFTISYSEALVVSVLSGAAWDIARQRPASPSCRSRSVRCRSCSCRP